MSEKKTNYNKAVMCHLCSKVVTCGQLEYHLRIHSGERPFSCDQCGMTFRGKAQLRAHFVSHSDVKDQVCSICDFATKYYYNLRAHMKKIHNINIGKLISKQNNDIGE